MTFLLQAHNVVKPSFKNEIATRYEGRVLTEKECVQILWKNGIRFSSKKGRARNNNPLTYLENNFPVPSDLRNIVITNGCNPGNKLWGRIDFLVNHCRYQLLDERS